MIKLLLPLAVALLPVLLFLVGLILLDSFKLVRSQTVVWTIAAGCAVAAACYGINVLLLQLTGISTAALTRYIAPVIEETAKASFLLYLIRGYRVGFMVDAAIRGFAIGTGFAILENLNYIQLRPDAHLLVWVIRGFGTALMHGGATAIVGITTKSLLDRSGRWRAFLAAPGLLLAIFLHGLYNHFFVTPLISTLLILILFPVIVSIVFRQSENTTREWLGTGFDTDREVLEMISSGVLADNPIGQYLHSLKDRFPSETVADMLCLLRVQSELAIKAKGMLLMKEAGFGVPRDPEAASQLNELHYLRKSIGQTGLLALRPFLRTRSTDLWQLQLLQQE
jgi:RsiW-degrading membrane proteinase PrsW (M82 family)